MSHSFQKDFAPFEGKIWLNAASEGPLPLCAAHALREAIEWKSKPYLLDNAKFPQVVTGLKQTIGQLIGVDPKDVILANSASYGLHILANGFPWQKGDEILLMQNDFPTDILPWLALEGQGVKVVQIKPKDKVLTAEELAAHISKKTKLFCISQVHTFTGYKVDVEGFARICHDNGVAFVLNLSQSAGSMPIDVKQTGADAVVCAGYKWLCGPYGTGFAWFKPELREKLNYNQAYWISSLSEEELKSEGPIKGENLTTARKFDVFGTANFFNFVPFTASINYWLKAGLDNVKKYHDQLIDQFLRDLDLKKYDVISPVFGKNRSSLMVISHRQKENNMKIFKELQNREVYTAFWKGNIRLSAHVYNTNEEMARVAKILNEVL